MSSAVTAVTISFKTTESFHFPPDSSPLISINMSRKAESGAELLARLYTRPNPQSIDSFIFGEAPKSTASSSAGQLIEIFGEEGTGKSELILHLATKVCLPQKVKGLDINGMGAKVIFVDTDFKFSILRFAVILEKQIKHVLSLSTKLKANEDFRQDNCKNCNHSKSSTFCEICTVSKSDDEEKSPSFDKKIPANCEIDLHNKKNISVEGGEPSCLTNSDIEDIINDSLERFFVIKVSSSQQLIASLMSLENTIPEDSLYSLLIIDSISAYYWLDKSLSGDGSSNVISSSSDSNRFVPMLRMNQITDIISGLINSYGITCLAVSSALFANKNSLKRRNQEVAASQDDTKDTWLNSEYLGKHWIGARTRKIVLSKEGKYYVYESENLKTPTNNGIPINAFCDLTKRNKNYLIKDDFMSVLEK